MHSRSNVFQRRQRSGRPTCWWRWPPSRGARRRAVAANAGAGRKHALSLFEGPRLPAVGAASDAWSAGVSAPAARLAPQRRRRRSHTLRWRRPWRGRGMVERMKSPESSGDVRHGFPKVTLGDPGEPRSCRRVALGVDMNRGPLQVFLLGVQLPALAQGVLAFSTPQYKRTTPSGRGVAR